MALYGISYAIASLGCTIGPFLVVTATTFRAGDISAGLLAYTAYAIGMGLVVGVLAVTAALASQSAARLMRRAMPYITPLSGALLVLVGAYVAWYGIYQLRIYAGEDNIEDPVITAAGAIQSTVAGWVEYLGPAAFLLALAVLAATTTLFARRRSRRPLTPEPSTTHATPNQPHTAPLEDQSPPRLGQSA